MIPPPTTMTSGVFAFIAVASVLSSGGSGVLSSALRELEGVELHIPHHEPESD